MSTLSRSDYRTLVLAALGGALEFYDFIIFVFFAVVIGQLFFPPDMPDWLRQLQTFGIFAAGYLARPLGGIVMAHFGDLLGRKRMFMLSIILMAVPTLAIGLLSAWLRQWLHETPVFREMQLRQMLADELPLKKVLRAHRPAVILTMLLTWLLSAAIVVMILMTPTLVQKLYAIPAAVALQANSIATVFLSLGCVIFGVLADRYGAGRVLMAGCAMLGITSALFYQQVQITPENINGLYALCGFFVGVIGVVPSVAVMAFPPVVRFSGLSFSYNVAYAVFGGLTPVAVSMMLPLDRLAPAHYVEALSLVGVLIGLYLWRRG